MSVIQKVEQELRAAPRTWLVTGAAGFIGSHLAAWLLSVGQKVVGLDNFVTGHRRNLDAAVAAGGPNAAQRWSFIEGDIADLPVCQKACTGVDFVLHQAALGSVPRSIEYPLASHRANVDGFINMLVASRDAKVKRFVYASSSSVYGDHPALPKKEDTLGQVLSPYAATKLIDEVYAGVFFRSYGMQTVGLRYFNVFGPRQDPNGAYAAVIPRWLTALATAKTVDIYGDGETSRDFCFIANVVQANVLSATTSNAQAFGQAFNVALGGRTTLKQLFYALRNHVARSHPAVAGFEANHLPERAGDVRHSQADISKAQQLLGYAPTHSLDDGIASTVEFFLQAARA